MLWQKWQLLLGIAALVLPLTFSLAHARIRIDAAIAAKAIAQNSIPNQRQHRTALIIGNSNYKLADTLANPVNDATDIANSLQQLGFDVILLKDADLRQMEEALESFNRRLRQGGVGLFYYAGHGLQVDGENYLIPVNARLEREQDVRYEAMAMGKVLNVMEDAANDANFIILDACRNNPFSRQWRSLQRGLAAPTQSVKGTLIAYSTAPGKVALDGDGRNSPYTTALLRNINTPSLDVEQMFKQVRAEVLQTTIGKQTPWESSSLVGSFAFNLTNDIKRDNLKPSTPQPSPLTPPNSQGKIAFIQPPSLVEVTISYSRIKTLGATYYFTVHLPENAGRTLQQITINQPESAEYIRFNLNESVAFKGTRSQKGEKLELKDISSDEKTQTVSFTFDPPVSPGSEVTIGLKALQNPQRNGVYVFGVTAFPMGETSSGQFLGFGKFHFISTSNTNL
ncbi:peptidase C14 caspase catalytic subunit p20 [Anabaenopsis circularis NIES-21]|uniref:Peptidase C14 caspase catalytic subunit p20 n=2 Tax=Nostocales TaxID=1161 RepID=A0A1Z4GKB9_9CYAN|nr:DUF2808 domain-containing protein [Nostoc cycadae]BAY17951.1 peptidase C14 caspase catalytic subunit p20 [Anabaenopsis circularis NIES-21]GBE91506.1 peptidase C14 caspase catalytic subunit p20 [Nostoc cycadae WK-1]